MILHELTQEQLQKICNSKSVLPELIKAITGTDDTRHLLPAAQYDRIADICDEEELDLLNKVLRRYPSKGSKMLEHDWEWGIEVKVH